ncbi:hypothetical protein Hanom_Chr03g00235801 [Helianthus anomalus]
MLLILSEGYKPGPLEYSAPTVRSHIDTGFLGKTGLIGTQRGFTLLHLVCLLFCDSLVTICGGTLSDEPLNGPLSRLRSVWSVFVSVLYLLVCLALYILLYYLVASDYCELCYYLF